MPERIFALFSNVASERDRVRLMLRDAGLFEHVGRPLPADEILHKIELPNEKVARRLTIAAKLHDLDPPTIQRYIDPTHKELAAAPLLVLRAFGPGTDRGHPREGTSYDDSQACRECGAGLLQTSPLRMRKTDLPKAALATGAADELLLHDSIAGVVTSLGFTGVSLRPVLDTASAPVAWQQVVVDQTMPPMLLTARGMTRGRTSGERPCSRCGRDGWFNTQADPFMPAYARSVLDTMPDFAWTYELFSTGAWANPIHGKRSLASRVLIVRPRVYAALKPLKLRNARWLPVRVD